jgi:GH24 family phage-related lysozyme (muramidase)
MKHSHACSNLVKQFEGCVLTAYPDPATKADPWTIGVGHTGPEVKRGVVWTQAQADEALDNDLARFDTGVAKLIGTAPTTQAQFDALVSLAFNIGLGNLGSSTLLRLHKAGSFEVAATQFVRWNKAAGRIMNGLTRRRMAEASLYRGLPT